MAFLIVHKGHHLLQTRPSEPEGFLKDAASPKGAFMGVRANQLP